MGKQEDFRTAKALIAKGEKLKAMKVLLPYKSDKRVLKTLKRLWSEIKLEQDSKKKTEKKQANTLLGCIGLLVLLISTFFLIWLFLPSSENPQDSTSTAVIATNHAISTQAQQTTNARPISRPTDRPQSTTRRPANCTEARAMGLTARQAAQWSHLDRDGDGVACYGD